jgi:predicted nucleotidyltransferase
MDVKQELLTKQAKARFCGYAFQQLYRIERHKRWLDNPPLKQPTRAEFGLPEYKDISVDELGATEAIIKDQVKEFSINQDDLPEHVKIDLEYAMNRILQVTWRTMAKELETPLGTGKKFNSNEDILFDAMMEKQQFNENMIELLKKEKRFKTAQKDWNSYQTWLKERNPVRAEIEKKFGFDCKNAAQLVRLIRMGREILEHHQVNVKRPDAQEILAIRQGAWTYEQVCDFARKENEALEELVKKSKLPSQAPLQILHQIVFDMIVRFNGNKCAFDEKELSALIKSLLTEDKI